MKDMQRLVESLKSEIPKAFDADDYERQKAEIYRNYQEVRAQLFEELANLAEEQGFVLKRSSSGFVTVPIVDGEEISSEDIAKLPEDLKEELEKKTSELQFSSLHVMRRIQAAERAMKEQIKELEKRIGLFAVGYLIDELKEKYQEQTEIIAYLEAVQKDILEILMTSAKRKKKAHLFPGCGVKKRGEKYRVNLIVDNKDTIGAPVVVDTNPTYYNLIGRVEYENKLGTMTTDYALIKAGSLLKANGGYLILQARDVLANAGAWEGLKRVLKTGEACLENLGEQFSLLAMSSLRPQAIPVQVKVILVGSPYLYQLLYHYDDDFRKLFKIKADFDAEMAVSRERMSQMASFVASHTKRAGLFPFDRTGVARLVEHSARLAGHQEKLSTHFNEIVEIIAYGCLDRLMEMNLRGLNKRPAIEESHRSNTYEQNYSSCWWKERFLHQPRKSSRLTDFR